MNIILLSGGIGKRLWPLSSDTYSKQFLQLLKSNETNETNSMVQRTFNGIRKKYPRANITIAVSKKQKNILVKQLGKVNVSKEPCSKNTFPAIILSAFYLKDIKKVNENEVVIISPTDSYVDLNYYDNFSFLEQEAQNANIVLIGVVPKYSSTQYGYIIPKDTKKISVVKSFEEKPSMKVAKKYINQKGLWNTGVFACKLSYLIEQGYKNIPFEFKGYNDLYKRYNELEPISFDYVVVEKEKNIKVVKYNGKWSDLGSWNTLLDKICKKIIGKGKLVDDCKNVNIVNNLNIPVVVAGEKDIVVVSTKDGIFVANKNYLKTK